MLFRGARIGHEAYGIHAFPDIGQIEDARDLLADLPQDRTRRCRHHGIFVAVRKGAPRPDVSSPDALKRTLLAAKSISYVNPASGGASGIHFAKVLDRLGVASEMKSKTVFPDLKTPAELELYSQRARPRSACTSSRN